jgi:hypothetical protein
MSKGRGWGQGQRQRQGQAQGRVGGDGRASNRSGAAVCIDQLLRSCLAQPCPACWSWG